MRIQPIDLLQKLHTEIYLLLSVLHRIRLLNKFYHETDWNVLCLTFETQINKFIAQNVWRTIVNIFASVFTIFCKIFIRRGSEKCVWLTKECYSCGVARPLNGFCTSWAMSIVYHLVVSWQHMLQPLACKESNRTSFVRIENPLKWKCRSLRYSNIYLLCDHLKRMKLKHRASNRLRNRIVSQISCQSARIDCCIVTHYELFHHIALILDLVLPC